MTIRVIAEKTPAQIEEAILAFSRVYRRDWELWLTTPENKKVIEFGRILRKWKAIGRRRMRRPRSEAKHAPPFLEDLIEEAETHLQTIRDLTLADMHRRTDSQVGALTELWRLFTDLPLQGKNLRCRHYKECDASYPRSNWTGTGQQWEGPAGDIPYS